MLAAAMVLCAACGVLAEEAEEGHLDSHHTQEVQSEIRYRSLGSDQTHTVVTVYDLYCQECQRVVEKDARQEEREEAHAWDIQKTEATCTQAGKETRFCPLCGLREEITLPAQGHTWGEWIENQVPQDQVCEIDQTMERTCEICGEKETQVVSAAPGHDWEETEKLAATCVSPGYTLFTCRRCGKTEQREMEDEPALGHVFIDASMLARAPGGPVYGTDEWAGKRAGEVIKAATCTEDGKAQLVCVRCQESVRDIDLPALGHEWGEWIPNVIAEDQICTANAVSIRTCALCGSKEARIDAKAPGHKWAPVSYSVPTCTEPGRVERICTVCGKEELIESPALGHSYMWVQVNEPSPESFGVSQYVCTECGDVAAQRITPYSQMYYNNTITSFGPTTRDLIGGNVWNRVTPVDLSVEGQYSYPLVASNLYTVGTATIVVEQGRQTVSYRLNSSKIKVHSESLVVYPDVNALRTGNQAASFSFDQPLDIAARFGGDQRVIIAITLKADYDAVAAGIQSFQPDQQQITMMLGLLD